MLIKEMTKGIKGFLNSTTEGLTTDKIEELAKDGCNQIVGFLVSRSPDNEKITNDLYQDVNLLELLPIGDRMDLLVDNGIGVSFGVSKDLSKVIYIFKDIETNASARIVYEVVSTNLNITTNPYQSYLTH